MARRSLSSCNLMPVDSYDFIDLEDPMQYFDHLQKNPNIFQHGSVVHPQAQDQMSSFADPRTSEIDEDGQNRAGGEGDETTKMGYFWQRVKWSDVMVRLMITGASYIGEDFEKRKGKWKSVSRAMAGRGFHVSPQQCEDKFNDLNKRYKRLNEILGRGTSCMVVEDPSLLDGMNLSEHENEEVRKILNSKQLFYEEMCSYHNGNRLFIPHDPDLQSRLQPKVQFPSSKRLKRMDPHENFLGDGIDAQRSIQLEERRLDLESRMLELEKQRFQWQRRNWEQDRELEKMKLENEAMKLVNERLALELECKNSRARKLDAESDCC